MDIQLAIDLPSPDRPPSIPLQPNPNILSREITTISAKEHVIHRDDAFLSQAPQNSANAEGSSSRQSENAPPASPRTLNLSSRLHIPSSPLLSPRTRVRTGVNQNTTAILDSPSSQTKIKTNGSLPRNSTATQASSGKGIQESSSSSGKSPSGPPNDERSSEWIDPVILPNVESSARMKDDFRFVDSDSDTLGRGENKPSPPTTLLNGSYGLSKQLPAENCSSSHSCDVLPGGTREEFGNINLRRQMSMRVGNHAAANSLSNRRYLQSLQTIGEIKRQLQDLDVHQSEVMVELDLERALLEGECSRVLSGSRPQSPLVQNTLPRNLSPQQSEINNLRKNLEILEEDLKELNNNITSLQNHLLSSPPSSHNELRLQIKKLQEETDSKKRQYENLEYRLLEAELANEEGEASKHEEEEHVREELQALDVQMRTLLQQTQMQTNMLSHRRHTLLDQLKAEYRNLHRISAAQAELNVPTRNLENIIRPKSPPQPVNINTTPIEKPSPSKSFSSQLDQENISPLRRTSEQKNPAVINRPLTRYLPQPDPQLNLEEYLENCGHDLDFCRQFVTITESTCSGYMNKLSTKFGNLSLWRKRWFVLDRNAKTLSYSKHRSMRSGVNIIGFHEIEDVYVVHDEGSSKKSSSGSKKGRGSKTTFCVVSWQRRYALQAPNPAAMRLWVEAISTGAEGASDYWQKI